MSDPTDDGSPDAFIGDHPPDPLTQVNAILPGSSGGPIESIKRAVITSLREAIDRTSLQVDNKRVHVDLEYPLKPAHYPGIWVQFSLSKFERAGLSHEVTYWDPDAKAWTPIQVWKFNGRITLSIVALKNHDRDQLSDAVLMMLAFSRTPEVWTTQPGQDTQQYRQFITSINDNPYVSITPNTDVINCGGQQVEVGVPWQPDTLAYTDSFSFDLHGQTQVQFMHDGAYTLAAVTYDPTMVSQVPPEFLPPSPAAYPIGQGLIEQTWRTL